MKPDGGVFLGMPRSEGSAAEPVPTQPELPPALTAHAAALVQRHPECFWYWRPDAPIRSLEDVRLVVRHLREYGGHDAWLAARELNECLSPRSRRTS
jgi:hypothetical protein